MFHLNVFLCDWIEKVTLTSGKLLLKLLQCDLIAAKNNENQDCKSHVH